MPRDNLPTDPRAVLAALAIRETEVFLAEAFRAPERYARIPIVRVGFGSFPPGLSREYWTRVLGLEAA